MTDEELHALARKVAGETDAIDKKQLRFNDIVECAKDFYNRPEEGVRELVASCSKACSLYVPKDPMWETLRSNYGWMLG